MSLQESQVLFEHDSVSFRGLMSNYKCNGWVLFGIIVVRLYQNHNFTEKLKLVPQCNIFNNQRWRKREKVGLTNFVNNASQFWYTHNAAYNHHCTDRSKKIQTFQSISPKFPLYSSKQLKSGPRKTTLGYFRSEHVS